MNNYKYATLLNILDKICEEAPVNFTSYKVKKNRDQARAKAFTHLFLKVKCGMMNFEERHDVITEGTQDGGIDAYYIDTECKKIFLIQTKFRTSDTNFETKKITANDLVRMEIKRILKGETNDSRGKAFSSKIKKFQAEWSKISDQAYYKYRVIILGNLENYSDEQVRRIIDNSDYEIFDFKRSYQELVYPLCSGTYYDPKEIRITIDLVNKEQSTLKQQISTNLGIFPIRVLFVPTREIGRIMSKYKNSILRYNPRNYLALSKNVVNHNIMECITKDTTNDFAIYNNGITIIADSFELTESTGTRNVGQVIMINPQIINGGQTAYVLSKIYDENVNDLTIFEGKEVMLKVIVLSGKRELNLDFIEQISNATNQQTKVEEADRRSNDKIQIAIEEAIFDEYGYFYERKKGEFYNGIDNRYIDKDLIVDRFSLLKAYLAWNGDASNARRAGSESLFKEKRFKAIMKRYRDFTTMFFAHKLLKNLQALDVQHKEMFSASFKYGRMAIISAIGALNKNKEVVTKDIDAEAIERINKVASLWGKFINYVIKKKENRIYILEGNLDYDKYYKGRTVNEDIKSFFK